MTHAKLMPGQVAPDATLVTLEGRAVNLNEAWRTGPALLVFLRHLG